VVWLIRGGYVLAQPLNRLDLGLASVGLAGAERSKIADRLHGLAVEVDDEVFASSTNSACRSGQR